ncbi:MAG: branched-chain amino acid transport system substrate-binding protein [Desulforhopalus sp.]|jgi:branched-chain amino acid transport system substrate-binding protein
MKGYFILILASVLILYSNTAYTVDNGNPVLVGVTGSMEGKYKEPSQMALEAFKYWQEEVNSRGGLLGREVKFIIYDDKSDKELTKKLYTKLIEEDKVDLVFSPTSTPLTISASDVSEKNKKLMLAIATSSGQPWQKNTRYLFQLYAPANRQFIGLLDIMAQKRLKSLALIYNDQSGYTLDMVKGIQKWAKTYKIDIVLEKAYQDSKRDLPKILKEIERTNAQGLINSSYSPDSYELLRLLGNSQYRPTILALPIAPVHPNFQKTVGAIADHVFAPSQWEPDERIPFPGTAKFIEGFKNFAGHMPSYHAASAYSACQLYEQAINKTQTIDNTILRDYVAALDTVTVLGRFKVNPTGMQVGHNSFIIQWQNGKKEIVWPQRRRTAKPVF